ncbi:MAG: hypothetical protein ACR2GR_12375 [Rhodothermales bacterium]
MNTLFLPKFVRSHTALLALVLALFVGLSACAPEDNEEPDITEEPMADMAPAGADLDATIQALQGDITAMDPAAAVDNINAWQAELEASGDEALQGIASDLGELKNQLSQMPPNGGEVGQTLTRLGEQTTQAAASAEAGVAEQLNQLGSLLSDAGAQLSGAGS